MLILFVVALLVMLGAPETLAGKALRRLLVEKPANALSRLRPWNLAALAVTALAGAALVALLREDGARLAMMGLPEAVAWLAAVDVAAYVEVFGAVLLVSAFARLKLAVAVVARLAALVRRRPRAVRPRRARPPASEDEDMAFPAYALVA